MPCKKGKKSKNYTFKYFNGKPYRQSDQGWKTKKEAQKNAKRMRSYGYFVRVVKVGKWWRLFIAEMAYRRKK